MDKSQEKSTKGTKKLFVKILGLSIITVVLIGAIYFGYETYVVNHLPDNAEEFYSKYKSELNDFVQMAFNNGISYIEDNEAIWLEANYIIIDNYYIYSHIELSKETIEELKKYIKLFKDNNISNVYINKDQKYVTLIMSRFLAGVALSYHNDHLPIEEIKEDNYTDNAWYVDDNWIIIELNN